VLAAFAMDGAGVGGLFVYTAAAHAGFAAFTVYRIGRRAPVPPEERAPYVAGGRPSRTTPVAVELDPRAPEPSDEEPAEQAARVA
jgi:hypothetical protein